MKRRKFDFIRNVDVFSKDQDILRVSLNRFSVKDATFRTRRFADSSVKLYLYNSFLNSAWFQSHNFNFDSVYRHRVFVQNGVIWSLHFLFKYADFADEFDTDMCCIFAVKCYEPK